MTRHGGIIFHKLRIIDGQRWSRTTNREPHELLAQGINLHTPVVDRWSPLAYSIGNWVHREVSNHAGFETALRHSFNYCFILQGHSLFEELGRDCMLCTKLRAKFLNSAMGPRHPSSYALAPVFWIIQANKRRMVCGLPRWKMPPGTQRHDHPQGRNGGPGGGI